MTDAIKVLLVDDHTVVREGLRRSLEAAGIDVVGEAGDGTEVVPLAERLAPDIVLMDISLPGQDGIAATRALQAHAPGVKVVILTMFADGATLQEAIRAGAVGYLVKDCTTAEIVEFLHAAAADETTLSRGVAESLLGVVDRTADTVLSRRETEVLQLVAEGASTAEVAGRLFISVKTVKNHLGSIYEKIDARDRTQAVLQALRMGIVRLD